MQNGRVTISVAQWQRATEALREKRREQPKKRWIRHFCYDLQAGKISSHSAKEASALFFEHQISSGININDQYILFELSDGADDAHGVKLYQSFKYENDPQRELILRTGVVAGEGHFVYSLIGSSNSGIQSHSYVFRRGSLEENERLMLGLMPRLRELEEKKGCAKRIKYQGLLFSGAQVVDLPPQVSVCEITSVVRPRPHDNQSTYDFTDGCGLISFKLARYLHEKVHGLGLSKKGQKTNVPSVFHIRYAGRIQLLKDHDSRGSDGHICKGIFLVDHRNNQTYEMCLRKSMLKEVVSKNCADVLGTKIGIIGWSKESPGRLSQQLICLLTASVPDQILLDIQKQQQDAVENATRDPLAAAWLAGLEPKAAPWYSFQTMLFGAVRDYQSGHHVSLSSPKKETASESKEEFPDTTTAQVSHHDSLLNTGSESKVGASSDTSRTKIPPAYYACISGRNHPRHLPENLTKVQVPLASCRTYFGAAFPETLSNDGFCIKEGECIVMLEDGPLEDEIVIVSRSPSYHPGDVRVLKNKASELPETHPVYRLSNCILFTTLGKRPDADKMGGGDLDGDKFLVVWDSRLVKFRDKIQSHKAQDYDVESSDQKSSRSMVLSERREKREADWIHSAAMLDSVMLGAIENSYYALAKEFGVVSEEINQLNQLFSQLIDRKPSAIETFEMLCKKAYNPQHAKKSLSDNTDDIMFNSRDSLWEKMLFKQKQLLAKVKEQTPDFYRDYKHFHSDLLNLCNPQYFDQRLSEVYFHFGACLHRKKATEAFQKIRDMVTTDESPCAKNILQPRQHHETCVSYSLFMEKLKTIMLNADTELSKPLQTLRLKQKARREVIYHQRTLYSEIVRSCEKGEIESIESKIEECRGICAELRPKLVESNLQLSDHKKTLLLQKAALERCESSINQLKDKEEELNAIVDRSGTLIKSLKSIKQEVEVYADNIGISLPYCGSFLGQEKQSLLSDDSASTINKYVLKFSQSLNEANMILPGRIAEIKMVKEIYIQDSAVNHCYHIQNLQQNFDSADSIHAIAQANQTVVIELLKDLSLSKEQHDAVKDIMEKCQALISIIVASLNKSTSQFKYCLLHSDVAHLVTVIREHTGLDIITESIEKELYQIATIDSDINRFKRYHRCFKKFQMQIPLQEKHALLEKRRAINSLQQLARFSDEKEKLTWEIQRLRELTSRLESQTRDIASALDRTYSPVDLEDAERGLTDDCSHETSIELGRNHIHREYEESVKVKWHTATKSTNGVLVNIRLKDIEDDLRRVCSIEISRSIGKSGEPLPVYKKRAEINKLIASNDALIVTAQTGSGKSTQVPQFLADDHYTWLGKNNQETEKCRNFRLCCTQPRRMAAKSIAERVSKEFQTPLGKRVGFRVGQRDGVAISDSKRISDDTQIGYVTEGLLLAQLRGSPKRIKNYDIIIIDEAHERNIETDLLLSFLRNHLRRLKTNPEPDDIPLKVVVMSASIDWQRFCDYFDGCPRLDCPGKIFDVEENYRPTEEDDYSDDNSLSSYPNSCSDLENDINWPSESITPEETHFSSIADAEKTLVQHATTILFEDVVYKKKEEGDVLIFFSGSREIWECTNAINRRAQEESIDVVAYPLYSSMDEESKNASKDPRHRTGLDDEYEKKSQSAIYTRKVICCTNIAETSLTIDGVRFVIDTGKAKKLRYSHALRCMTLREEDVAQAAVKQRKGRAGRTQTGWVYYLFSKKAHNKMAEYELPKILQTPVEQLILYSMYNCQCSIEELGLLDSPTSANIKTARDRLEDLGFVTYEDEAKSSLRLTEDGELAGILSSLQPEAVRMLLWANTNAPLHRKRVIKMAALLSIDDDIFIGPRILQQHDNKGFAKTTSRSSIELARDKSEEYAYEQDQGVHQLGDHFMLLREFEAFENERKRSLKTTSNKKLRMWCKARGLNYAALNQAQLLAERCHNELKKRKVLVDQKDAISGLTQTEKSSCHLTSDEAIIRAMMTGYFHQLVESNDPLLKRKTSQFTILSPDEDLRFQVRLDRDSCLWKLRNNTNRARSLDFIPDDDAEEENMDTHSENRQYLISLLLFTRLQSVVFRSTQEEIVFMQGATSVDVKWVCEQAPLSWLERVDLNELKSNMICGSVRSIGPRILNGLVPLIDDLKLETEAKDIHIDMDRGEVLIYGSQAVVIRAKETVTAKVETVIADFYSNDEKSVYSNQIGRFGSGLELQELCEGSDSKRYKGWLLKNPSKLLPTCQYRDPISIKTSISQSVNRIDVFVKNYWDVNLFTYKFNEIAETFNAQNGEEVQATLAKPKRDRFTFNFEENKCKQQSATNQSASQGKGGKAKRKRKRGNQVEGSQDSLGNNGSGEFSLEKCFEDIKLKISEAATREMDTLPVEDMNMSVDKLPFLRALAKESRIQTQFWKKHFTNVQFSPSHGCFEMFKITRKELENRITILYGRKTVLSINDIAERPKQSVDLTDESDSELTSEATTTKKNYKFTRSELCRFVSTLEDFRKRHPNVLWVCNYAIETNLDQSKERNEKMEQHDETNSQLSSTETEVPDTEVGIRSHNEDKEMVDKDEDVSMAENNEENSKAATVKTESELNKTGSLQPSFWLKSDYQRLLAVHDNQLEGQGIIDLAIVLYSFSESQPIKAISDCRSKLKSFFLDAKQLNLLLPDRAEKGTEYKVCVMCRRAIEIRFTHDSSRKRSKHLQGHRLTICGCAYCRECFRASAEQFADNGEPVQCRNCKRQVLARDDCQKIVRPSHKDEKDQFEKDFINVNLNEWKNLLHKTERKYCSDILVGGGEYSEINTCPDCSSHTVFIPSKPFFRCSAIQCPNIFCCTCRRVQSSLSEEQQKICMDKKCKREFED